MTHRIAIANRAVIPKPLLVDVKISKIPLCNAKNFIQKLKFGFFFSNAGATDLSDNNQRHAYANNTRNGPNFFCIELLAPTYNEQKINQRGEGEGGQPFSIKATTDQNLGFHFIRS